MISSYLAGVPKEEHDQVKAEYESAFKFRKRLWVKLEKDIQTELSSMIGATEFKAEEHIERLAKIRVLKKIQSSVK